MIPQEEIDALSEGDCVLKAQDLWDAGDYNGAADYVSALRGKVGERGASVEQTGDGKVKIIEPAAPALEGG